MPEDVVKGLREMVEEAAEGNEGTKGNEATAKEQVVEKEWGMLWIIVIKNVDSSDDRNVIILIAFMFLVLIGMFYIASVLEKGLKWVVCSKHRSSENIESAFVDKKQRDWNNNQNTENFWNCCPSFDTLHSILF